MKTAVQLVLFGPMPVHIVRRSAVTQAMTCALCRVSLALAGTWDRLEGCHNCPGPVEPAPPWAALGDDGEALEPWGAKAA